MIEFFDCDNYQHNYHYGYDDSELYSEEVHLAEKFGSSRQKSESDSEALRPRQLLGKVFDPDRRESQEDQYSIENLEFLQNLTWQKLSDRKATKTTVQEGLLTNVIKRTKKKVLPTNTTLYDDYDQGESVRDTEEFESMMAEYMNLDERQDIQARKQRRRQIRTLCGQIISTIKKKLNTIWWKTFWKQTGTTPTRIIRGVSTPWFRLLYTPVGDSLCSDSEKISHKS